MESSRAEPASTASSSSRGSLLQPRQHERHELGAGAAADLEADIKLNAQDVPTTRSLRSPRSSSSACPRSTGLYPLAGVDDADVDDRVEGGRAAVQGTLVDLLAVDLAGGRRMTVPFA